MASAAAAEAVIQARAAVSIQLGVDRRGPGERMPAEPPRRPAMRSVNSVPRSGGIGYGRARAPSKMLPRGSMAPLTLPAWPDTPIARSTLS